MWHEIKTHAAEVARFVQELAGHDRRIFPPGYAKLEQLAMRVQRSVIGDQM